MLKQEMTAHYYLRAFRDQLATALILLATLLIWVGLVQAQSGRRSTTTPTTTAPSVSGPKPVEKPAPKPPRLQLLVGIETQMFIGTPYYLGDTVIDNCVRRLGDAADVNVTAAQKVMNRAEAVRAAKDEKERFVVWLQIQSDSFDSGRQSKNGPDELYVSYIIFEPVTGKIKQSGRSHQQIYKTSRGGVSTSGRNSALYSEYALKQAARETAERVLSAFDISLRDDKILN
jgi:hypothetical protein